MHIHPHSLPLSLSHFLSMNCLLKIPSPSLLQFGYSQNCFWCHASIAPVCFRQTPPTHPSGLYFPAPFFSSPHFTSPHRGKKRVKWSCCVIGHRLSVSLALVVSPRATGAICKHVVYVRTVSLTKIGLKRCIQRHESWRRGLSQAMCNLIFVQFQISTGRTLHSEVADVEATVFFPSCPQVNE